MSADYHTHTPLCHHATGSPAEYIASAKQAGLHEYGVSDHAPMPVDGFDDWRMNLSDLPRYLAWVDEARHHAGEDLQVRVGLECDWISGDRTVTEWNEHLQELHPWDYLIGSIHYLGAGFDFDNPKWIGRLNEMDVDDLWSAYWSSYCEMAQSGLFDILGHPDLIKKFGHRPAGDLRRFYEPVIDVLAERNQAIELNTAGWHKPCAEQYPAVDFLKMAAIAGVPMVVSSDAHTPAEVGRDRERATELLKEVGFSNLCRFAQRARRSEPIS